MLATDLELGDIAGVDAERRRQADRDRAPTAGATRPPVFDRDTFVIQLDNR